MFELIAQIHRYRQWCIFYKGGEATLPYSLHIPQGGGAKVWQGGG